MTSRSGPRRTRLRSASRTMEFAQGRGAIAPDHDPRGGLARCRGEMCGSAVDEETHGHGGEAKRELGGNREILAAPAGARVEDGQDRTQQHDPDRIERLELRRLPGPQME